MGAGDGVLTEFQERVNRHRAQLQQRSADASRHGPEGPVTPYRPDLALSWEWVPPIGQSDGWFREASRYLPVTPPSARDVARQLARLCGHDSEVTIPWRSLADAVASGDALGRSRAYVEQGTKVLVDLRWVEVETTGEKRGAKTTFRLLPAGDPAPLAWVDYAGHVEGQPTAA